MPLLAWEPLKKVGDYNHQTRDSDNSGEEKRADFWSLEMAKYSLLCCPLPGDKQGDDKNSFKVTGGFKFLPL